jgi:hypothetical protein
MCQKGHASLKFLYDALVSFIKVMDCFTFCCGGEIAHHYFGIILALNHLKEESTMTNGSATYKVPHMLV